MRKLFLLLFLLNFSQTGFSQTNTGKNFYNSLYETLKTSKKPIKLHQTNYSCLGDSSAWEVLIKPVSNKFEIQFFRDESSFRNSINKLTLDTSYQVLKKYFLKKVKNESNIFSNRMVIIEVSYKNLLINGDKETEYFFRKGIGLFYILRYNKTWETYFTIKQKRSSKI